MLTRKETGVTLQYTSEFSRLTGADFAGVPAADSWSDALAMMQNGEADAMYMIASTPERLEYLSFTTPHYTVETSIVTSNDRETTLEDENISLITIEGYANGLTRTILTLCTHPWPTLPKGLSS